MLELTSFQMFFMVLHGCVIFFAIAHLLKGRERHESQKIVSFREFQTQNASIDQQKTVTHQPAEPQFRDVHELASIHLLSPSHRAKDRFQHASMAASHLEDTVTDFATIDLSKSKIRRIS
jgi:hypothetical protein